MKKVFLLIIFTFCLSNCKSSKTVATKTKKTTSKRTVSTTTSKEVRNIINHAKSYKGTRYKYGGTSKKGIDCSGLVVNAFMEEDIQLPRTTKDLSKEGNWVDVKTLKEGDLLFFATKKNSRKINHVGIVVNSRPGHVEFIHSTTSKGVIISTLSERYWYLAYVQARRVM